MLLLFMLCTSLIPINEGGAGSPSHDNTQLNLTHIIMNTILYCGPSFVCDKTYLTQFGIPSYTGNNFSACGECLCDEFCYERQEPPCCPDKYFQYGYSECKDFSLVIGFAKPEFYSIIIACPNESNTSLITNCTRDRSDEQLLHVPPVSSFTSKRSYKNQYCALCHNITNFREWNFELRCPKPTEFNYLSTYAETSQLAKEKNCSISYSLDSYLVKKCPILDEKTIASCNVSGTWQSYDKQIEMACRSSFTLQNVEFSVVNAYRFGFKNIFCAMCNPPKFDHQLSKSTTKCTDAITSFACEKLPELEASFPYKNHFCLMCDRNSSTVALQDVYMKEKEESYEAGSIYPFITRVTFFFKSRHLKYHVAKSMKYYNDSSNFHQNSIPSVNLTNLVRTSFALSGTGSCDPEYLPSYTKPLQRNCSCELGCMSSCCDDFAVTQPWTCIKDYYPSPMLINTSTRYLTIGGCLRNSSSLSHLCTNRNSSDIYQMIPITTISENKESYANIFCYLCNQKQIDDLTIERLKTNIVFWGIETECKWYINHRYFSSLQDFINFADLNHCFIRFTPPKNAVLCSTNEASSEGVISKCDENVELLLIDEEVKHACEQIEDYRFPRVLYKDMSYKNKFCVLCNNVNMTKQAENCEVTNNVTALFNKTCSEFPRTSLCSVYRNRFCQMCHDKTPRQCIFIDEEDGNGTPIPTNPPPFTVNGYRSMFSISLYDQEPLKNLYVSCLPSQIYDDFFNSCENITCLPGKILVNGSCLPLLKQTKDLRYTMALKIQFLFPPSSNTSMITYLKMINKFMLDEIRERVGLRFMIENFILLSFSKCSEKINFLSEVYIYLRIFFASPVYRNRVEEILLEITNFTTTLSVRKRDIGNVKILPNQFALFLPSVLWKLNAENNCWILPESWTHGKPVFRNVLVDPLLTCPQVVLNSNTFGISWGNIKSKFTSKELSLSFQQLQNFDGKGIRICVKDLPHYIKKYRLGQNENPRSMFLTTVTITCIGISLVCLVLTFITYATFTSLQTVPGLNNMLLIASLFSAQLIFLVRQISELNDYDVGTIILSMASHFCWLSTFLWLQVCSFHMFLVFSSKVGLDLRKTSSSKIVIKYACYAFGFPFGIFALNVIITLVASGGKETGYDKIDTLFTYKTALIITFIIPLTFVCATNLIFYIITITKIITCPHVEGYSKNKIHFSVYIKLFTLTGLTWTLQVIDAFLVVSALSYVVVILNGLQGLFIFVSYVCNARVVKMWRAVFAHSVSKHDKLTSRRSETTKL